MTKFDTKNETAKSPIAHFEAEVIRLAEKRRKAVERRDKAGKDGKNKELDDAAAAACAEFIQAARNLQWKEPKKVTEEKALLRRITNFPEEIQITGQDIFYWGICENARGLHRLGKMTKTAILNGMKEAMSAPERNYTAEVLADFEESLKEAEARRKRIEEEWQEFRKTVVTEPVKSDV